MHAESLLHQDSGSRIFKQMDLKPYIRTDKLMPSSRILIFLSLCLIFISCSGSSKTKSTTEEEKLFVEIYVRLARVAQEHKDDPDSLAAAQEAVFQKAGVDREEYDALIRKMEASPERWAVIWERIVKKLEEEVKKKGG
jgi:hypothetical protein